jgi:uncharacterized protein (TIGR03085 family)
MRRAVRRATIRQVSTYAATERSALADALDAAGPDAPTLCEGWTASDLAAHLASRERRADSGPGLVVPFLAGYTDRVRRGYLRMPFPELVDLVRTGPPWFSAFTLPGVDDVANLVEHFVHCEDVRRGRPGWVPRALDPGLQDELWSRLKRLSRSMFRRSPVGVVLVRDNGERVSVGPDGPHVVLGGPAGELLLYAAGRTGAATVTLDGPAEAVRQFQDASLGL